MNWEQIQGNWKQSTGKFVERYGVLKEEAETQLAAWQVKVTDAWFDDSKKVV